MSFSVTEPFWYGESPRNWPWLLFGGGRFSLIWPRPADPLNVRMNTWTRLVLYLGLGLLGWSLLATHDKGKNALLVLLTLAVLLWSIIVYYRRKAIPGSVEGPNLAQVSSAQAPSGFLTGVQHPTENPYGNPMPYEPGVAVRSAVPPKEYYTDDCLAHMYRGTTEWDQNLFFYRIPDPTLMARQVFWPQDPRPDIVSNEAACGDRKCR